MRVYRGKNTDRPLSAALYSQGCNYSLTIMSVTLRSERLQEYDIFHGILLSSWKFGLKYGFYVQCCWHCLSHTFTFEGDLFKYFN